MKDQATELKPCPFCGGEASFTDWRRMSGWVAVACNGCGAMSQVHPTNKEAARAWNTRAERTCNPVHECNGFATYLTCSECHEIIYRENNYCRHCGAKVEGDE